MRSPSAVRQHCAAARKARQCAEVFFRNNPLRQTCCRSAIPMEFEDWSLKDHIGVAVLVHLPVITEVSGQVAGQKVAQAAPSIVGASVTQANKSAPGALARYQTQEQGSDYRVG